MQVVRVRDIGSLYVKDEKVWMAYDQPPGDFVVGDVIELTEERRRTSKIRGTLNDERRRLVSEWEATE